MIQDVAQPLTLFPEASPKTGDWVFGCQGETVAMVPWTTTATLATPLLALGAQTFFLGHDASMTFERSQCLRQLPTAELRFGAFCSLHLAQWLLAHRYCGACATLLMRQGAHLVCPSCGREVYPSIAPAVIVGLTYQGKLLVTRYAGRPYRGPALVAGYCEVGETAEATCLREAWEETGLKVQSLRYYASQPWGLSGSLLLGFFGEVADPTVTLADGELAEATWFAPEDLPEPPDAAGALSLTATMIQAFKKGEVI